LRACQEGAQRILSVAVALIVLDAWLYARSIKSAHSRLGSIIGTVTKSYMQLSPARPHILVLHFHPSTHHCLPDWQGVKAVDLLVLRALVLMHIAIGEYQAGLVADEHLWEWRQAYRTASRA
jgi:hypothetical protein